MGRKEKVISRVEKILAGIARDVNNAISPVDTHGRAAAEKIHQDLSKDIEELQSRSSTKELFRFELIKPSYKIVLRPSKTSWDESKNQDATKRSKALEERINSIINMARANASGEQYVKNTSSWDEKDHDEVKKELSRIVFTCLEDNA